MSRILRVLPYQQLAKGEYALRNDFHAPMRTGADPVKRG